MRAFLASFVSSFIVVFFWAVICKSQVFTPTIANGIGGAGRASVDGGEAIWLNPAAIAHMREYFFGSHYALTSHPREGDASAFGLQISDGTPSNVIPGGVSYFHRTVDLPGGLGSRSESDYQIALAGMVLPGLALGVSPHYFTRTGAGDLAQLNANVGLLWAPYSDLGIGLVGYDVGFWKNDVTLLNPTYALGLQYMVADLLRVRFDLVRPDVQVFRDRRMNAGGGIESYFASNFVFHLGCQWLEILDETNVTTGFGFHGPRLSLDYTFQKDIRSASGTRHLVDLWMPF